MSSFQALILLFRNLLRLVAFLRNLMFSVKMFHRFNKMMIRLLMNMRRFKGSQFGSVIKALIFPKLLVSHFLLRLILSLEKLIVFGAWEVVSAVLNLSTPGVIVPPPQGVLRVLKRVTNSSFVKPEAGQGFFEAQGARKPAQASSSSVGCGILRGSGLQCFSPKFTSSRKPQPQSGVSRLEVRAPLLQSPFP
jgi:hypothetical protein